MVAFAISFPVSVIFFTLAIFYTSVALAVFSFYIATLVSSFVVGKIYFEEDIDRNKQIALAFIVLAVILFTNPFESFSIDLGFTFGLISGIIQTIASSFQKIVSKSTDRLGLVLIQTFTGLVMAGSIVLFMGNPIIPMLPLVPTAIMFFFGLTFLAIAYLFIVGFKYTNLNVGSILVSSELLFGPAFAYFLLSEKLSTLELLGALATVMAVYFANKK